MPPAFVSPIRFNLFVAVVVLLFGGISARLFYLHVVNRENALQTIEKHRTSFVVQKGRRGEIVDAKGNVLASSRSHWVLGLDPLRIDARDKSLIPQMASLLGMQVDSLDARFDWGAMYSGRIRDDVKWRKIKDDVDDSTYQAVMALGIKGVYGYEQSERYYPAGGLASHVIGFVNKEGTPVMGVERTLDFYLRDTSGWRIGEINGTRREIRQLRSRDYPGQDGFTVELTIDINVQRIVEEELDMIWDSHQPESATVIVSNPHTGAILAMANRPGFDPNAFWKYDLDKDLRNRAISDVYEPGSTFKILAASAFVNERLGDRHTRFDCSLTRFPWRNRMITLPTDDKHWEELELREVLIKSSNRGAALAGLSLGERRLFDYCRSFGFGSRTGIELSGEEPGLLRELKDWDTYTASRVSIGYGIGVTPLQIHNAMCVIANGGTRVTPWIVRKVADVEGRSVIEFGKDHRERIISEYAAREIRECLNEVVSDEGTGRRAILEGVSAGGKTGTSRKLIDGEYDTRRHLASFSGFFPGDNPELVVTVMVNDPRNTPSTYGGRVAAPAFRNVAQKVAAYYGIRTPTPNNAVFASHP